MKANLVVNSSDCVVVLNSDILCVQPDVLDVHEQIDGFCFWMFFRNSGKGRELQNQCVELLGRIRWFMKANLVVNSSNCVVVLNPDILCVQPDVLDVHEQIYDFCFWMFFRNSGKGRELQNQYVELLYVWPKFGVRRRAWNRSCTLVLGGHGGQFGSSCSSEYFHQICRRPLRCML
jgi:hypothetical protein